MHIYAYRVPAAYVDCCPLFPPAGTHHRYILPLLYNSIFTKLIRNRFLDIYSSVGFIYLEREPLLGGNVLLGASTRNVTTAVTLSPHPIFNLMSYVFKQTMYEKTHCASRVADRHPFHANPDPE